MIQVGTTGIEEEEEECGGNCSDCGLRGCDAVFLSIFFCELFYDAFIV
jgi:hypothetical protein